MKKKTGKLAIGRRLRKSSALIFLSYIFLLGKPKEENAGEENKNGRLPAGGQGTYVEGQWQPGRWLNGDQTHQTHQGRHLRLPPGRFAIQRIQLYRYR